MRLVDRLVDRLLAVAASRWPEEQRDELSADWRAELAWLRTVDDARWRRLRFAASLAARGPDRDGRGPVAPPAVRRAVGALAILMLAGFGSFAAGLIVTTAAQTVPWVPESPVEKGVVRSAVFILVTVVLTGAMMWLGSRAGARMPAPSRGGDLTVAVVTVLGMLAGAVAPSIAASGLSAGVVSVALQFVAVSVFVPVIWWTVRLADRGRTGLAWFVGLVGGWVVLNLAVVASAVISVYQVYFFTAFEFQYVSWDVDLVTALLWTPADLVGGTFGPELMIDMGNNSLGLRPHGLSGIFTVFLGFATTYAVASRRSRRIDVSVMRTKWAQDDTTTPREPACGALAAAAITAWAATIAYVKPIVDPILQSTPHPEFHLWSHELRMTAILATVLAGCALLSRRRRIGWPAAAIAVGMLALDALADRADWTGTGAFLTLAGLAGGIVVAVAWSAMRWSAPAGRRRRVDLAIAVPAAVCAFSPFLQWYEVSSPPYLSQPSGLPILTAVIAVTLGLIAVTAVVRQDGGRWSRGGWFVLMVAAVSGGFAGCVIWPHAPSPGMVLAGPAALIVAGAAGWVPFDRRHRLLRWPGAVSIAVAATFLAAIPVVVLGQMLGGLPLAVSGASHPADGLPTLAGVLAVSAVPATVLAWRVTERGTPVSRETNRSHSVITGAGRST